MPHLDGPIKHPVSHSEDPRDPGYHGDPGDDGDVDVNSFLEYGGDVIRQSWITKIDTLNFQDHHQHSFQSISKPTEQKT